MVTATTRRRPSRTSRISSGSSVANWSGRSSTPSGFTRQTWAPVWLGFAAWGLMMGILSHSGADFVVAGALGLITPALFSRPPPRPPGEEGVVCLEKRKDAGFFKPPLSRPVGGRLGERGLGE